MFFLLKLNFNAYIYYCTKLYFLSLNNDACRRANGCVMKYYEVFESAQPLNTRILLPRAIF